VHIVVARDRGIPDIPVADDAYGGKVVLSGPLEGTYNKPLILADPCPDRLVWVR
jgi:hypothetical protein